MVNVPQSHMQFLQTVEDSVVGLQGIMLPPFLNIRFSSCAVETGWHQQADSCRGIGIQGNGASVECCIWEKGDNLPFASICMPMFLCSQNISLVLIGLLGRFLSTMSSIAFVDWKKPCFPFADPWHCNSLVDRCNKKSLWRYQCGWWTPDARKLYKKTRQNRQKGIEFWWILPVVVYCYMIILYIYIYYIILLIIPYTYYYLWPLPLMTWSSKIILRFPDWLTYKLHTLLNWCCFAGTSSATRANWTGRSGRLCTKSIMTDLTLEPRNLLSTWGMLSITWNCRNSDRFEFGFISVSLRRRDQEYYGKKGQRTTVQCSIKETNTN